MFLCFGFSSLTWSIKNRILGSFWAICSLVLMKMATAGVDRKNNPIPVSCIVYRASFIVYSSFIVSFWTIV